MKTGWGTASGRRDLRGLEDDPEHAEQRRKLLAKVRTGPISEDREPPLVSWNPIIQNAVVADEVNGCFINDEGMNGGRS